jgi:Flp pilus assembly protein TadD
VARAYRRAGILDQAYDYLSRSLTVNGPDAAVYEERARLLRDWGNPDLGLADAYRAVYLAPHSAAMQNTLGTLLYQLGHRQDAEDRFEQALALDANAWYALANLCHSNLARGRTREAITQCRQATAVRAKSKR